ncbi:MAG: hypothetical protein EA374_05385 [Acholeplasmatales bacterium]|nr:MAG: hypothetical protein EA374_05385 [Acholeplasmatales bacterium]
MHKMENTPKTLTIMGMIVEGMAFLVFVGLTVLTRFLSSIPKEDLINQGFSESDAVLFLNVAAVFYTIFIIIGSVLLVMFIVNLVLFTKLMKGHFTEKQAKQLFVYQAVWGGISLLFNTITGVLYLVSAIQAHTTQKNHRNRRKGSD